jgi:hypothetical protein
MRVTADGKVGIGTSTPGTSLDVQFPAATATTGNIRIVPSTAGQARYHLFNNGATAEWLFGQKTSTDHSFKLSKSISGSESDYVTVTGTGNVGIGTTTPGGLFELSTGASGTLNGEILLQRTRSNTSNNVFLDTKSRRHTAGSDWTGVGLRLQHQVDSTIMGYIEFNSTNSAQDVVIGTDNTARFRVASDGSFSSVIPGSSTLYPNYACRAWVNFDGTTASPSTIRGSGNVSSVTKVSTGVYTLNFATAMPDVNYAVTGSASTTSGSVGVIGSDPTAADFNKITGAVTVVTYDSSAENAIDRSSVNVVIFR